MTRKKITYILTAATAERNFIIDERIDPLIKEGFVFDIIFFDTNAKRKKIIIENRYKRWEIHPLPKLYFYPPSTAIISKKIYQIMKEKEKATDLFHIAAVDAIPAAGVYKKRGGKKPIISRLNSWGILCPTYEMFTKKGLCKSCNYFKRLGCIFLRTRNILEIIIAPIYALIFPFEKTRFLKYIDKPIAISKKTKESYITFYEKYDRSFKEKVIHIDNFIDDDFIQKSEKTHRKNHDNFNFIYIGRIQETKGIPLLLKAFSEEFGCNENVKLTIIGKGNLLRAMEKKYIKNTNIKFKGFVLHKNLAQEYKNADVFIHPAPVPDTFGRTILEAMHCEIPCIISNIWTPPDIAGKASLLFKINNKEELKKQMRIIYHDKILYKNLKQNTAKEARKYNKEKSNKKLIKIYKALTI